MPDVDLKTQITNLLQLQAVDTEIYNLKREKAGKPAEINAIDAAFEAKKQYLAELEKSALDLQKLKKDHELGLGTKEENTKKLQSQLFSLKTNKEYQAMLQQIADSKADASVIEDKILEVMEQLDKVKADVEAEKLKLKDEEKVFAGQKDKVHERTRMIDDRLAQLEAQRKQVLPGIDPQVLAQYERILSNRDGLAIVTVKNNSCGGCNMHVPPQVINLIKMYERMITCEVCNRILSVDENESA